MLLKSSAIPDLASWLREHGLGRYVDLFARHEIDFSTLRILTEQDLTEIGLPFGPRKRLLAALKTSFSKSFALSIIPSQLLFCDATGTFSV